MQTQDALWTPRVNINTKLLKRMDNREEQEISLWSTSNYCF